VRGPSAPVAIDVAIAFAVSWNPLVKSKTSAVATTTRTISHVLVDPLSGRGAMPRSVAVNGVGAHHPGRAIRWCRRLGMCAHRPPHPFGVTPSGRQSGQSGPVTELARSPFDTAPPVAAATSVSEELS